MSVKRLGRLSVDPFLIDPFDYVSEALNTRNCGSLRRQENSGEAQV